MKNYNYPLLPDGRASQSEHTLQTACVQYFRTAHPELSNLLFAIPNGGARSRRTGAILKAEGLLAGVPDLLLATPRGNNHALFIEMKNGTRGHLSNTQSRIISELRSQGYQVEICRSFDQFRDITETYLTQPIPQ